MTRTPIHPGEILADELRELGLSAAELARLIEVPPNRVSQIMAGKRNITADTALRLGHYFGTSPEFWMNLQKTYEIDRARVEIGIALQRLPQRSSVNLNLPGV
jgi:addiction module HigA family antidote